MKCRECEDGDCRRCTGTAKLSSGTLVGCTCLHRYVNHPLNKGDRGVDRAQVLPQVPQGLRVEPPHPSPPTLPQLQRRPILHGSAEHRVYGDDILLEHVSEWEQLKAYISVLATTWVGKQVV